VIVISGFIMMFIPLILSQGQNLSLLNTGAIEQQTIQLVKNKRFLEKIIILIHQNTESIRY
jgi:hypothetical protein